MLGSSNNEGASRSDTSHASPLIHLALTDDWELRGDGSGDIAQIQFRALRELLGIFQNYRARTTFNVELMQQLTFRKLQHKHPELGHWADAWDDHVRDAFRDGHDIQLHVHPQWSRAEYVAGKWKLSGDWSLPNYPEASTYAMLADGKDYIENLLRSIDASYRCVSFRSGSSSVAPAQFILSILAKLGIVFDMSIIGGFQVHTRNLQIDYSNCEESVVPFYPQMNDARKVSNKREPIVCVPIFSFTLSRRWASRQTLAKISNRAFRTFKGASNSNEQSEDYTSQNWSEVGRSSLLARAYKKGLKPSLTGKQMTADLALFDYAGLKEMLGAIRKRARASGLSELPIILTNHSKDIKDFSHIARFVKDIAEAEDMRFATLTDIANKLNSGEFAIRMAEHQAGAPI